MTKDNVLRQLMPKVQNSINTVLLDCVSEERIVASLAVATVIAAELKNRRRSYLFSPRTVPSNWTTVPTSHGQHDAELCVPAQHTGVSLSRFFERIGFNHRTHSGYFSEAQSVLGIGWDS